MKWNFAEKHERTANSFSPSQIEWNRESHHYIENIISN
jgi:hypothetical protein